MGLIKVNSIKWRYISGHLDAVALREAGEKIFSVFPATSSLRGIQNFLTKYQTWNILPFHQIDNMTIWNCLQKQPDVTPDIVLTIRKLWFKV